MELRLIVTIMTAIMTEEVKLRYDGIMIRNPEVELKVRVQQFARARIVYCSKSKCEVIAWIHPQHHFRNTQPEKTKYTA